MRRKALFLAFLPLGMAQWVLRPALGNLRATKGREKAPEAMTVSRAAHGARILAGGTLVGVRSGRPARPVAGPNMTTATEDSRPPKTKQEGQRILKHFGMTGYKIDEIGEPELDWNTGETVCRMFCLTREILQADNTWKRFAKTVVLRFNDETVHVAQFDGWEVE